MTRLFRNATLIASIALVATVQPLRPVMVKGRSMNPTLHDGRLVVGTHTVGQINRGDVVVFRHDGENVVKRVAFLEGDSFVEVRYDDYWIVPLNKGLLDKLIRRGQPWRRFVVPQDSVYVVGDNPMESTDSREFGPVPVRDISLRVLGVNPIVSSVEFPGQKLINPALLASR